MRIVADGGGDPPDRRVVVFVRHEALGSLALTQHACELHETASLRSFWYAQHFWEHVGRSRPEEIVHATLREIPGVIGVMFFLETTEQSSKLVACRSCSSVYPFWQEANGQIRRHRHNRHI
jgi:hypothetical protein